MHMLGIDCQRILRISGHNRARQLGNVVLNHRLEQIERFLGVWRDHVIASIVLDAIGNRIEPTLKAVGVVVDEARNGLPRLFRCAIRLPWRSTLTGCATTSHSHKL